MPEPAEDVLQRVREEGGRLLRVERAPLGPGAGGASAALRLTFDVGRVVLRAGADGPGGVEAEVEDPDAPAEESDRFLPAEEEEPWWRLLGQPLTRVEAGEAALTLQFRREDARPRRVALVSERGALGVRTAR